jgi:hypothetical protein
MQLVIGWRKKFHQHYQIYPSKCYHYLFVRGHVHVIQGPPNFLTHAHLFLIYK